MYESCKPVRKPQLEEDGTEDVMQEPRPPPCTNKKTLTEAPTATIMNIVQVEVSI